MSSKRFLVFVFFSVFFYSLSALFVIPPVQSDVSDPVKFFPYSIIALFLMIIGEVFCWFGSNDNIGRIVLSVLRVIGLFIYSGIWFWRTLEGIIS